MQTIRTNSEAHLRGFWNQWFKFDWVFGTFLLLAVCIPRFFLVLDANITGGYQNIGIIMAISAMAPFVYLSKQGRYNIGLKKPDSYTALIYSFVAGIGVCILLYLLGNVLFSHSTNNWFVYIGRSYAIPEGLEEGDKFIYFSIFAITGMIFSPIGEELFFRGIVHSSFKASLGEPWATIIDGLAFAITHLAHFGLVFVSGIWRILPLPALLWVISMFLTSLVFYYCKQKSGSLLGAIISHAGFNLMMIYLIFYQLQ